MKRIATVIGALTLGGALIAASSSHAASFGAVPNQSSASPSGMVAAVPTLPLLAPPKIIDLEKGQVLPRVFLGGTTDAESSSPVIEAMLDVSPR